MFNRMRFVFATVLSTFFVSAFAPSQAFACYDPVAPVARPPLRDDGRILEAALQTEPTRCAYFMIPYIPLIDSWISNILNYAQSPSDNFYSAVKETAKSSRLWDLYSTKNKLISQAVVMKIVERQGLDLDSNDIRELTTKPPHESYIAQRDVDTVIQARCALFLASPACKGIRDNSAEALDCSGSYTRILSDAVRPKADLRGCFMKSVQQVFDFVLQAEAKKLITVAQLLVIEKTFDSVFGRGTFGTAYKIYASGRDFYSVLRFFDEFKETKEKSGWNWLKTLAALHRYRADRMYCYRGELQGQRACDVIRDAVVGVVLSQTLGPAYKRVKTSIGSNL